MVTPEALRAALAEHPTVRAACLAAGCSLQRACQRADLRAVLAEHRASRPAPLPRDASRHLGRHKVILPDATARHLDALRAKMAPRVGPAAASRSAVARGLLAAALTGPLPEPAPVDGLAYFLDLGPLWDEVGAAAGTSDPREIAGVVRAMLAPQVPETMAAERKAEKRLDRRGTRN